jgi:hypothetical protein
MGTDRAHRQRVIISPISDSRRDDGGHFSAPRRHGRDSRDRACAQQANAVVINAAPVKREDQEAPAVALSRAQFERLSVPVWSGQISQRAAFLGSLAAGASVGEIYGDSACKVEIARLWSAIERSVDVINRAQSDAGQGKAA